MTVFTRAAARAIERAGVVTVLLAGCAVDSRAPGAGGGSEPMGQAGTLDPGSLGGSGGSAPLAGSGGGGSGGEAPGSAGGSGGAGGSAPAGEIGPPIAVPDAGGTASDDAGTPSPLPEPPAGPLTGTISEDFGRARVLSEAGKSYIVQNNNWGPTAGDQTLRYEGPSFEILAQSGTAQAAPVSFPSVYIGRNGFTGTDGALTTSIDDDLPIALRDIVRIDAGLAHNVRGDGNAMFELWFALQRPAGEYDVADAYLTVWLNRAAARNPFGTLQASNVSIAGRSWDVYIGPRDVNLTNSASISYLPTGAPLFELDVDLALFVNDAIARDVPGIGDDVFLTDLFGGIEVWSGGVGFAIERFSANVVR